MLTAIVLVATITAAAPRDAFAQRLVVTPFTGASTDGKANVGASVGVAAGPTRIEAEYSWLQEGLDRPADVALNGGFLPAAQSDINTFVVRLVFPYRVSRRFEPYASVGLGIAAASRTPQVAQLPGTGNYVVGPTSDLQAGVEAGAGAILWMTNAIGIKGGVTYFNVVGPPGDFSDPAAGRIYTNLLRETSFTRITAGISFKF